MSGLLITGTDTGVGKTWVSCHLARALVDAGLSVGVMKPCETGMAGGPRPDALPASSDARQLFEASGCKAPVGDVLPYLFKLPAAPSVAALEEGVAVEMSELEAAFGRLNEAHDVVLVEGAGGLRVPLSPGLDYVDLARQLDLEVLVVARTGLGTVNHTALTEQALVAADRAPLGIVLNSPTSEVSGSDRLNLGALAHTICTPVLAELPYGEAPPARIMRPVVDAVCEALRLSPEQETR
jgi:dethiobiotin synthetase